jgi:hypothetical protein
MPRTAENRKKKEMETKKKWDTPSEAFMAEARLCRNLGDTKQAEAWERQAEMERTYEKTLEN